jgi:hypothetical protein
MPDKKIKLEDIKEIMHDFVEPRHQILSSL